MTDQTINRYAFLKKDMKGRLLGGFDQKNWTVIEEDYLSEDFKKDLEYVPANILFRMTEDGEIVWDET